MSTYPNPPNPFSVPPSIGSGSPGSPPLVRTDRVRDRIDNVVKAIVGRPLFWVIMVSVLFALPLVRALLRPAPPPLPLLGEIPAFSLKQAAGPEFGQLLSATDGTRGVRGRAWVASFLDPLDPACEPLAKRLSELQHKARNLGDFYRLMTFLPANADPTRTGDFAAAHHPNPNRWYFVFGSDHAVEDAFADGLKRGGVTMPIGNLTSKPLHDKHVVFLVDRAMRLRGFYDLNNDGGLQALTADLGLLANFDQ